MARKSGIAAILTVAVAILPFINPLVARADTFQYTVHEGSTIGFSFSEPTLPSSGEVTSGFFDIAVPAGNSLLGFSWNSAAGGGCELPILGPRSFVGLGCAAVGLNLDDGRVSGLYQSFTAGSFLAPGTYSAGSITVAITDVSVPEPSTIMLLGIGVLSLFGMKHKTRLF